MTTLLITTSIILILAYLVYQSFDINSRFKNIENLLDPSTRKDKADKSIYIGDLTKKELTFSDVDDNSEQLLLLLQLIKNQNWDFKLDETKSIMGSYELRFTDNTGYKEFTLRFYTSDNTAHLSGCRFTSSIPRINVSLIGENTSIKIHKIVIDFAMEYIEQKRNKDKEESNERLRLQKESIKEILKDHYRDKKLDELL